MSELIDHLARLTGFRDRDVLDVTLVGALQDLLRPRSVAIHRISGEADCKRWLLRARVGPDGIVAQADSTWTDPESLPRLSEHPARHECLVSQMAVRVPGRTLFPLIIEREVTGVLEIESAAPLHAQAQQLVSSILRIYHNFEALLEYSERDTLTGLLNRKTFDDSFMKATSELPAAVAAVADGRRSGGGGYWLGIIDIDHFKRVNDNFGHLLGDEVLLLLSRLMRSSFRCQDRLYRFGGEEFVVLLRCASTLDAMQAFTRLRRNCERFAFPQVGHITVSIGFTAVKLGDSPSGAFERADKAVYHAKGNGRNQVQCHAALIASGHLVEDRAKAGPVELF